MDCPHKSFVFKATVNRLRDQKHKEKATGFMAEIRVFCSGCGLPFEFRNAPAGYSMVSPEGTQLRVPLQPSTDLSANAQDILQNEETKNLEQINRFIQAMIDDSGKVSDGAHTFEDLYDLRNLLWIALCKVELQHCAEFDVIRTRKDGQKIELPGYFLLCVNRLPSSEQISFHLPDKYWDLCAFALTRDYNARYDGHTTTQVAERIRAWCGLEKSDRKP